MNMRKVNSSTITAVGYDPETETLGVEFRGSGVYRYQGVPAPVYHGFFCNESAGKYFHQVVRGRFPTIKMATGSSGALAVAAQ